MAVTFAIHATGIVLVARAVKSFCSSPKGTALLQTTSFVILLIVVVAMTLAAFHLIESGLWAVTYVAVGALPTLADAMLYSVDSMATRGSAGFTLDPHWRMMGAVEAADGMLLFGISTAFLFSLMHHIWTLDRALDR